MKTKRILFFLVLFALFSALIVFGSSAEELSAPSDYNLWVGGVAVTAQNAGDILGDGHVVYDAASATLTLTDATVAGYVATSATANKYELSVYSASASAVNVVLRGTCVFSYGIRLNIGSVKLESADVIFRDTAMTAFCLFDGNLTLTDSRVTAVANSRTDVRKVALINTDALTMTGSGIAITGTAGATAINSLIYADSDCLFTDSHLSIDSVIPSSSYGLYTAGNLTVSGGSLSFAGQMYSIYAPGGTVSLTGTAVRERDCFYALDAAGLVIEGGSFDSEVFYGGINIVSDKVTALDDETYTVTPTELALKNGAVSVKKLAFASLEPMIEQLWENMNAERQAENGTYSAFLAQYSADYSTETVFTSGISAFSAAISLDGTNMQCKGFTVGLYATGNSSLFVSADCDMTLSGEKAALILFSDTNSAATVSDRLSTSGNELYISAVSGDLTALGAYLFTYAKKAPSFDITAPYTETLPEELWDALSGMSKSVRIHTVSPLSVILTVFSALCVLAAVTLLVLSVIRRRQKKQNGKPSNRQKQSKV